DEHASSRARVEPVDQPAADNPEERNDDYSNRRVPQAHFEHSPAKEEAVHQQEQDGSTQHVEPGRTAPRAPRCAIEVAHRAKITATTLGLYELEPGSSTTLTGFAPQMLSQYSSTARSEENLPPRAVLRIDMRVQCSSSCHTVLTRSSQAT